MKKVLIVDDAMFMRQSIKLMLERNNYIVAGQAANGVEAIKKYKELQPDIVTMDITMPDMDGMEALREIRKIDKNANVLMITALGQEYQVRESIILGAKNFLVKPFHEEKLIDALRHF